MTIRNRSLMVLPFAFLFLLASAGCEDKTDEKTMDEKAWSEAAQYARERLAAYSTVTLTTDMQALSEKERRMIPLLIGAAQIMDDLFWIQAYGDRRPLMQSIQDPHLRRFVMINYGPWDRLAGDRPFVPGVGPKPAGANFYPPQMTKEEFEAAALPDKQSLYTLLRRDKNGRLITVPYHKAKVFEKRLAQAAQLLKEAAALAEDAGLKRYLELRAQALVTDDYKPSDMAWLDMKNNRLDIVIGPIETYEDALFGYKAAYEAYVLVKDMGWSRRLARYASFLPELQRSLPVPEAYRREKPGSDSDLNAYDVIYYAGHSNAGSKTIAINLPNDEEIQLAKGTRRLQLKNAMRAKFDRILSPIADRLIADDQRANVTFDAFFSNVMFHEVAHGLGIKQTINGKGTVREALKEYAGALEEAKADVLGLYMITRLRERGEIPEGTLTDNYVTYMAGLFRSVRFGAASAHGKANMVQFNFFADQGAFARDDVTGKYRVDTAKMQEAVKALAAKILTLQGDGDYDGTASLFTMQGVIRPVMQQDLDALAKAAIPVDVTFKQGLDALGLDREGKLVATMEKTGTDKATRDSDERRKKRTDAKQASKEKPRKDGVDT